MVEVHWFDPELLKMFLDERLIERVEEQIKNLDPTRFELLGEYEESGDEIVLEEPDPSEGRSVKVVKHEGRIMVVFGVWEHGGFVEEHFIGEIKL